MTDLIPLKPFGLHLSTDGTRPVLIFKNVASDLSVPVYLNAMDAAVALAQSNPSSAGGGSPHRFAVEMLGSLRIKILRACFLEVDNGIQLLTFELEGHPHLNQMKVRADECISFCLHLEIPIFASSKFIEDSKVMIHEQQTRAHLFGAQFAQDQRNQGYLM